MRRTGAGAIRIDMPLSNDIFASAPAPEGAESALFDGILQESRDLISARLDDAISDMLDSADEVLTELLIDTSDREERRLLEEARLLATSQRDIIEKHFHAAYVGDFQRRSDRARRIGRPFGFGLGSSDELQLIGQDDLEETLKFNDMANKLRAYCDEELSALDQRVGVLLGDANLETKDNPFSPQVICDAFKHACREMDVEVKLRRVLLKLFDDHVLDDIRAVYKAVNALLVRHAILPKIRYGVVRGSSGAETGETLARDAAATAAGSPTMSAAQDLFAILQSLVSSNGAVVAASSGSGGASPAPAALLAHALSAVGPTLPAGAAGWPGGAMLPAAGLASSVPAAPAPLAGGGIVMLQGTELLAALTRIQRGGFSTIAPTQPEDARHPAAAPGGIGNAPGGLDLVNVLHELKSSSVGTGMGQLDRMTLDIIAMLFDELFDDPKVPNAVKGLIGRLQIPMLKVAIADKTFFSAKSHPARRLLDAVGEVALRLPAEFSHESPLFGRLEGILQRLVDDFQDDLQIFVSVREDLLALMAEEDQRIELESQAAAKRAEEAENLALARSVAQMELQTRLLDHAPPAKVRDFLAQQWIKLLLLLYVREGADSAAWKDGLEVVDQLLWSVVPKTNAEERRKLVGLVPSLIKRVTAGLKAARIEDEVRDAFFAELMQCHTAALGIAPQSDNAAPRAAPIPGSGAAPTAHGTAAGSAKGQVFAEQITVPNPFGDGEVKVESLDLDFTSEASVGARAKREASIRRALDNLQLGNWFEFRDPADQSVRRPARLIFISPRRSRYVFATDRAGKKIVQCTRAEISHRLRMGDAVKLDQAPEESLFDRIMSGLLRKLRGPGKQAQSVPGIGAQAATAP